MARLNTLSFRRRLENQASERTTEKLEVSSLAWDTERNAYRYEPEENELVTQPPWKSPYVPSTGTVG